jgi:hypothetical protein
VVSWSREGHSIITQFAFDIMSKDGRRYLAKHIGSDRNDLIQASFWADSEEAQIKYRNSEDWHFSHTPYRNCQPFVFERDCGFNQSGRCLVSGIADMALKGVKSEILKADRA